MAVTSNTPYFIPGFNFDERPDEGKDDRKKSDENIEETECVEEPGTNELLVLASSIRRPELKTEFFEWDFHEFLIPAADWYCDDWDSASVDNIKFNPAEQLSEEWPLCLTVGSDCGYEHPFYGQVTSHYGPRWGRIHKGIDIDLNEGDSVVAAFDGVVRMQRYDHGGFGNYVLIRHYNGLETIYAHLSEAWVSRNQFVRAGEVIGLGGSTGRSTGPHLHFETRFLGQAIDPTHIIDFENGTLKSDTLLIKKDLFHTVNHPQTNTASKVKYHKVRSGETLSSIARKYGTSVNSLCRLNGMKSTSVLRAGRTIRVR